MAFVRYFSSVLMTCFWCIQKVASAWSRSNLPPPELDQMFRAVEAVYKANRSLLSVRNHMLVPDVFSTQSKRVFSRN